ncbi:hypothetical protein ONZ51_g11631 [Trametes cubensis]|uniref:Uncharacterized protein n=1 Tax=Trametes cubensis TaxID=1111947 RepID=A0AAD7TIC4_9APHY|nr:hypothetical protein ONZ51_g11631 [Trametes cubensis]
MPRHSSASSPAASVFSPASMIARDYVRRPERERMRGQIRRMLNDKLRQLTGSPYACMYWKCGRYATLVVARYGYKLVGWPSHVPFCNLSDMRNGKKPLVSIRDAWIRGDLRFELATPEDIQNALAAPETVQPRVSS